MTNFGQICPNLAPSMCHIFRSTQTQELRLGTFLAAPSRGATNASPAPCETSMPRAEGNPSRLQSNPPKEIFSTSQTTEASACRVSTSHLCDAPWSTPFRMWPSQLRIGRKPLRLEQGWRETRGTHRVPAAGWPGAREFREYAGREGGGGKPKAIESPRIRSTLSGSRPTLGRLPPTSP